MAKVITSEGLNDFVTTGKTESMPDAPPAANDSPPPEHQPSSVTHSAEGSSPPDAQEGEAPAQEDLQLEKDFTPEELKLVGDKFAARLRKRTSNLQKQVREHQSELAEATDHYRAALHEKWELERERDALRQQLDARSPQKQQAPQTPEPRIQDFLLPDGQTDWVSFVDKRSEWRAEQAVAADRRAREEQARQYQQAQLQAQEAAKEQATAARYQAAVSRYEDFPQVMEKAKNFEVHPEVFRYLKRAELGPDLTYYLLNHPEEIKRIHPMEPELALAEVVKLEAQIKGVIKPPPGQTGAEQPQVAKNNSGAAPPPPITTLSGSSAGAVVTDPARMDFKQLREYERSRKQGRR